MKTMIKGDTLVEVLFAVAVFSLVAISVISVMNAGINNAQSALEITMARSEIDAQAEALRYIHGAYTASKSVSGENGEDAEKYGEMWKQITELANELGTDEELNQSLVNYSVQKCEDLYNESLLGNIKTQQNAFVVDTDNMKIYKASDGNVFYDAGIYPRLLYATPAGSLVGSQSGDLARAEGIYVVGVKDASEINYDFYIRTCWYSPGSSVPSTISTVIRLYNPDWL